MGLSDNDEEAGSALMDLSGFIASLDDSAKESTSSSDYTTSSSHSVLQQQQEQEEEEEEEFIPATIEFIEPGNASNSQRDVKETESQIRQCKKEKLAIMNDCCMVACIDEYLNGPINPSLNTETIRQFLVGLMVVNRSEIVVQRMLDHQLIQTSRHKSAILTQWVSILGESYQNTMCHRSVKPIIIPPPPTITESHLTSSPIIGNSEITVEIEELPENILGEPEPEINPEKNGNEISSDSSTSASTSRNNTPRENIIYNHNLLPIPLSLTALMSPREEIVSTRISVKLLADWIAPQAKSLGSAMDQTLKLAIIRAAKKWPKTRRSLSIFPLCNIPSDIIPPIDTALSPKSRVMNQSPISQSFKLRTVKQTCQLLAAIVEDHLRKIHWKEFEGGNWANKDRHRLSPNITHCIQLFDRISAFVVHDVLLESDAQSRANYIQKIVQLADRAFKSRQFELLASLIAGLNASCISRLKQSWQLLSKKDLYHFEELAEFVSPLDNYSVYRSLIKQLTDQRVKFVPILAIILRDYFAIHTNIETTQSVDQLVLPPFGNNASNIGGSSMLSTPSLSMPSPALASTTSSFSVSTGSLHSQSNIISNTYIPRLHDSESHPRTKQLTNPHHPGANTSKLNSQSSPSHQQVQNQRHAFTAKQLLLLGKALDPLTRLHTYELSQLPSRSNRHRYSSFQRIFQLFIPCSESAAVAVSYKLEPPANSALAALTDADLAYSFSDSTGEPVTSSSSIPHSMSISGSAIPQSLSPKMRRDPYMDLGLQDGYLEHRGTHSSSVTERSISEPSELSLGEATRSLSSSFECTNSAQRGQSLTSVKHLASGGRANGFSKTAPLHQMARREKMRILRELPEDAMTWTSDQVFVSLSATGLSKDVCLTLVEDYTPNGRALLNFSSSLSFCSALPNESDRQLLREYVQIIKNKRKQLNLVPRKRLSSSTEPVEKPKSSIDLSTSTNSIGIPSSPITQKHVTSTSLNNSGSTSPSMCGSAPSGGVSGLHIDGIRSGETPPTRHVRRISSVGFVTNDDIDVNDRDTITFSLDNISDSDYVKTLDDDGEGSHHRRLRESKIERNQINRNRNKINVVPRFPPPVFKS